MHDPQSSSGSRSLRHALSGILCIAFVLSLIPTGSLAASSWNPALLVNTESFNTIDAGDGTTDIELRFGDNMERIFYNRSTLRFQFSRGITVGGGITATGALVIRAHMSGSSLTVDRNATVGGTLSVSGATLIIGNVTSRGRFSGSVVHASTELRSSGSLLVEGTLSGGTIAGFGLVNCVSGNKLLWNSTTKKFECATDQGTTYTAGQGLTSTNNAFTVNTTLTGSLLKFTTISGSTLRISSGGADVHGPLAVSGALRMDGDLIINDDQSAADVVLTFGQPSTNQTLKYLNSAAKFQFSRGLSVLGTLSGSSLQVDNNASISGSLVTRGNNRTKGNLSGATLTVDGTLQWRGQTYTAPTSQTANTFLKTDGNGTLTWTTPTVGNGSGNIISLHPEYPNAVYFASGATTVGQLSNSYDASNKQNHYRWSSTKSAIQDYWVAVRARVPDNFSSWDPVKPIELRYRTGSGQVQGSYLTAKLFDTAGSAVALTGGATLANTSWTTANITGPQGAGTWTPKSMFTLLLKLAASTTTSSWFADAGYINFNFETTTP